MAVYTSCSRVREELSELPACIPLKPDTAYHIQDRAFVDMMITDSLLIFIASKDSTFFHVYNKITMEPVINFGKKGNAGFEFNHTPFFMKQYYDDQDFFEVFDLFSIKKIGVRNIIETNTTVGEIKSERMDEQLIMSREIAILNNDNRNPVFVGTSLGGSQGLFFLYDKAGGGKKWIVYDPKTKVSKNHYDSMYYGQIEVSPDQEVIVYCPRFFDRIIFYDKNGELKKALNFSDMKIPKTGKEYLGVSNDEWIYSYQTYRTRDHLYVIRPLQSLNNLIQGVSPVNVQVLKLTWDGSVSTVYEHDLKLMPTLFCVDEENNKILFHTPLDSDDIQDISTEISVYNL